ncbi:MAG TPA: hypothetical protein VFR05_02525 [Terriglobia bacterium]|nr:hypothetical protein [Terriglobia bacterium]
MAIHDEAALILQLYDLRREETMRTARNWYAREFNPESMADIEKAFFGEHSAHLRMVASYWDMAAALVNNGAISAQLFNDTNGEQYLVFGKLEPFLKEIRGAFGPQFAVQLEKLIDATPGGRERAINTRERMKAIRARALAQTPPGGQ